MKRFIWKFKAAIYCNKRFGYRWWNSLGFDVAETLVYDEGFYPEYDPQDAVDEELTNWTD